MRSIAKSKELFERAKKTIPGCAQTFSKGYTQYVQGVAPIFLERGKGSRVWDVDGNEYIDYVQGLLPNILGYADERVNAAAIKQLGQGHSFSLPHPIEIELAEKLCSIIPCSEMVRFGKNGSDATAGSVRVARAYTGREVIACCGYHGWQDWFIGSTTRNKGVPKAVRELTKPFIYNDINSLKKIFDEHPGNIAAVIMEPVNFVAPAEGFLQSVKDLAHKNGALLIFDEICCGWHIGLGGAQKLYGITPDLACFGKAMGNGFPIAAIVGKKEVMSLFEEIFVSFTFAGEVASMAASLETIRILEQEPVHKALENNGKELMRFIKETAESLSIGENIKCQGFPQWHVLKFLDNEGKESLDYKSYFQQEIVKRGILLLGTHNLNYSLTDGDIEFTKKVYGEVLELLTDGIKKGDIDSRMEGSKIQTIFKVR